MTDTKHGARDRPGHETDKRSQDQSATAIDDRVSETAQKNEES